MFTSLVNQFFKYCILLIISIFFFQLCFDLAYDYDRIRRYYWAYVSSNIENKYNIKEHEFKIDILNNTINGDN